MYADKDIALIKDLILRDVPDAVRVIIFGSYARGTATESSDIDFLILTEENIERKKKLPTLAALRLDIAHNGYNADVIIKNESDYRSETALPTLSKVIEKEGKLLWRRN